MVKNKLIDILLKQKKYHDDLMNKYNKYKEIKIVCPFCNSETNIWSINNHLKGKNCLSLCEIYLKTKPEILDQLKIKINELKKQIKYQN